jgi:hypothetical protein
MSEKVIRRDSVSQRSSFEEHGTERTQGDPITDMSAYIPWERNSFFVIA